MWRMKTLLREPVAGADTLLTPSEWWRRCAWSASQSQWRWGVAVVLPSKEFAAVAACSVIRKGAISCNTLMRARKPLRRYAGWMLLPILCSLELTAVRLVRVAEPRKVSSLVRVRDVVNCCARHAPIRTGLLNVFFEIDVWIFHNPSAYSVIINFKNSKRLISEQNQRSK